MVLKKWTVLSLSTGLLIVSACSNQVDKKKKETLAEVKRAVEQPAPVIEPPQPVAEPERPKTIQEIYNFGTTGRFSIQVESGRKTENAEKALKKWKALGFDNAYVTIYPPKDSSETDTWYRLRLGRFTRKDEAKQAAKAVSEQFGVSAWVDNTKPEIPAQ